MIFRQITRDDLAEPDHDHRPFEDGWELKLGAIVVRALHAPGHRAEHTAFALIDRSRGEEPWAVLTGDSLFVGDAARPDRGEAVEATHDTAGTTPTTRLHPGQ